MTKISKRMRHIRENAAPGKIYNILEALKVLKELSKVKFTESVDVSVKLGVDTKKSEQVVKGSVLLPAGTGKTIKVAVFAQGEKADQAKQAGADIVGFQDLEAKINGGDINFDLLIATPDAMPIIGKLGKVLGPKGLMPNPKLGTVTQDVGKAVENAKKGQVRFKTDKAGIVHSRIGTIKFDAKDLKQNLETLIKALKKAKPASSKGIYLQKVTISSTMGPGLIVDLSSLEI
ncbi:MAG: 50S ribosomal protein L1 [Gammaproteobacteria bacterium]|nr:50S ribosomal protein L1 [Gammaproteobacteria bacterium]